MKLINALTDIKRASFTSAFISFSALVVCIVILFTHISNHSMNAHVVCFAAWLPMAKFAKDTARDFQIGQLWRRKRHLLLVKPINSDGPSPA
jgi:hypothetical protein